MNIRQVLVQVGDAIRAAYCGVFHNLPFYMDVATAEQIVGYVNSIHRNDGSEYNIRSSHYYRLRTLAIPNSIGSFCFTRRARLYADLPTPFPPIVVDKMGRLIDGKLRVDAARLRGEMTISAYVAIGFKGDTFRIEN